MTIGECSRRRGMAEPEASFTRRITGGKSPGPLPRASVPKYNSYIEYSIMLNHLGPSGY